MNVVGKVGSLITQGVYSVTTPFHPFGGAVDVIAVQQQDGSFRSTPWYVQFGKFQGVLKGAEKVVRIHVNGAEANFHMNLDNSGEAYFIREADSGQDCEKNLVHKDEKEAALEHNFGVDNSPCNVNKDNVEQYKLQSTMSDLGVLRDAYSSFRSDRLERSDSDACRFYDFRDDRSYEGSVDLSSEIGSSLYDNMDSVENFDEAQGSDSEMVLVSVDGHVLTAPISSAEQNTENVQLITPQFHLGTGETNEFPEGDGAFRISKDAWDSEYLHDLDASPCTPDPIGTFNENNNTHSHECLLRKLEEHALENQGTDGMHQVEVCQDERETYVQKEDEGCAHPEVHVFNYLEIVGKSEDDGEAKLDMHVLEIGDAYGECVHGNKGVDDMRKRMHEYQHQESDSIKDQDRDFCELSDVEDASPGIKKEDKFQSCLDLNIAAVSEPSESEDPSLEVQVETKDQVEVPTKNVEVTDETEIDHASDVSVVDVKAVIDINVGVAAEIIKNNDSSASAASPVLSEAQKPARAIIETTNSRGTSLKKDSLCEDELVSLKPLVETVKSKSERDVFESESDGSKLLESQMQSLSEERQSSSKFEISLCRHLLHHGMGSSSANEIFYAHHIPEEEFRNTATSVIKNENLVIRYREKYFPWDKAAPLVLGKAVFGLDLSIEYKDAIPVEQEVTPTLGGNDSGNSSGLRWRLWPIPLRVNTVQHSSTKSSEELFVDSGSGSQNLSIEQTPAFHGVLPRSETITKPLHQKVVRTNIPPNEQIASLNLKEGQNEVTFSFSTRVLGLQQVEAHIYLWKWNAQIVISDVDGTITKSDVLGQFMPLVGKDWSQSGVAQLFSAIKENGYQLLFLSARAIVQAYLTKSFLFNLRQDGKMLPNGPVLISPNGLFPSLFREGFCCLLYNTLHAIGLRKGSTIFHLQLNRMFDACSHPKSTPRIQNCMFGGH